MGFKDLTDYGAVGDGVTDDTAAIQAAFNGEYVLEIPSKKYRVTSPIIQSKVMRIEGAGQGSEIWGDFSTSQPAVINVNLGTDPIRNSGRYCGVYIHGNCPAMQLDLSHNTSQIVNRWEWDNVFFENSAGGYSFVLANPTNDNGLFCSTLHDSVFHGGLSLIRAGDSLAIEHNTITGAGDAIHISDVAGASHTLVWHNNITNAGYALNALAYTAGLTFSQNQCELSGPCNNMIAIAGGSVLNPKITDNNLSSGGHLPANASIIVAGDWIGGLIDGNTFQGATTAIYILSSCRGVFIDRHNVNYCTQFVVNQGVGTVIE